LKIVSATTSPSQMLSNDLSATAGSVITFTLTYFV
jgi:hypothetical protein